MRKAGAKSTFQRSRKLENRTVENQESIARALYELIAAATNLAVICRICA
jgi:hypothetical protein